MCVVHVVGLNDLNGNVEISLKIHQLVHSSNNPYERKTCHKRFKQLLELTVVDAP